MLQKLAINLIIFAKRDIYVGNSRLFDIKSDINMVARVAWDGAR
jgi:hypothetical protein